MAPGSCRTAVCRILLSTRLLWSVLLAWGMVSAQGNGRWLPHWPGLALRGAALVWAVCPQVTLSIVSALGGLVLLV